MTLEFEASRQLGDFTYKASFDANEEIVVLFGHSGAGKSLTLQFIAGVLRPDSGRIRIAGASVFDSVHGINVRPQERGVGYVVQDLALFPHMTVAENVGFGISERAERDHRVSRLLDLFGIAGLAQRRPATLSGGQRQRVALARAMGRQSRLLLLDEPFSALDESLRASLRRELLRLRRELGLTIVFVTHDLREAHLLADRLAVFDGGGVLQFAPRDDVFRRPTSRRVAELTGCRNIFPARVVSLGSGGAVIDASGVRLRCASVHPGVEAGDGVDVCIRPERVNLRRHVAGLENHLEAGIAEQFAFGATHTLNFNPLAGGPALEVELASRPYEVLGVAAQRTWTLELPAEDLHVMPAAPRQPQQPSDPSPAPG